MPHVAIILAVHSPDLGFLKEQLKSLHRQTHSDVKIHAVIADKVSGETVLDLLEEFQLNYKLIESGADLNPVQAFEFGLTHALTEQADYFAFCDQDDIWREDRIAAGLVALQDGHAGLVHSDARIVDQDGMQMSRSLFRTERRAKSTTLTDLLYRNTVTGMTTLFARNIAEAALPFPQQDGVHFYHDLWLALVAQRLSSVAFIDQTLVDYRQHDQNVVGAKTKWGGKSLRARTAEYALARFLAEELDHRYGPHPETAPFVKSRSFGWAHFKHMVRFLASGHPVQGYIAMWFAVIPLGRRVWAMRHLLRHNYTDSLQQFDNRLFALSPGHHPPDTDEPSSITPWWEFRDGRMHPKFEPIGDRSHARTVVFVPTLNPTEAFAGIATALDLGLGIAERGHSVTFVATDMPLIDAEKSRAFLASRNIVADDDDTVELVCGVTAKSLSFHPDDQMVATAWWTAHLAQHISDSVGIKKPFHYLIQDYEPCFYPWGTEYTYARSSYDLPHTPIFNSVPLRDYFASLGLCATNAICFRPSIDTYAYQPAQSSDRRKRVAIYGRPEVARNLFPFKIAALGQWIELNGFGKDDIEIVSIGLKHADIAFPNGVVCKSLGKLPWGQYPSFLGKIDLGLSLMCSPHPSHPPIEMAAAGAQVVTNDFATKTLAQLSDNIHTTSLGIPDVVAALDRAWDALGSTPSSIDLTPLGPELDDIIDLIPTPPKPEEWAA